MKYTLVYTYLILMFVVSFSYTLFEDEFSLLFLLILGIIGVIVTTRIAYDEFKRTQQDNSGEI